MAHKIKSQKHGSGKSSGGRAKSGGKSPAMPKPKKAKRITGSGY